MFPVSDSAIQFTDDDVAGYLEQYKAAISDADALCNIIDPETTPYVSKYKARELVYSLSQKLEAYSVVARATNSDPANRSDKKKAIEEILSKVASLRIRSGTISYDCEEPHNAERDLDHAGGILFPVFLSAIEPLIGPENDFTETDTNDLDMPKFDDTWYPPDVILNRKCDCIYSMKCLNMMGILWAGRGQVKKSFIYLHAAKNLYHDVKTWLHDSGTEAFSLTLKDIEELESLFVHNLFYLAQAFGHIGDLKTSSRYCHETLRRQCKSGFENSRAAFNWAKNCASMSNFYLTMEMFKRCRLALLAAEKVLSDHVIVELNDESTTRSSEYFQLKSDAVELEADLHRKLGHVDLIVLKKAFEREVSKRDSFDKEEGDFSDVTVSEYDDAEIKEDAYEDYNANMDKKIVNASASATATPQSLSKSTTSNDSLNTDSISISLDQDVSSMIELHQSLFPDLSLPSVTDYSPRFIASFEQARAYFLRATAHIEAAKRYFQLDGSQYSILSLSSFLSNII